MIDEDLREEFVELLPQLNAFRTYVVAQIEQVIGSNTIDVRSRIKSWEAIREQLSRKRFSHITDFVDLIGIRVVVPDVDTLNEVGDAIASKFLVTVQETMHLREEESSSYIIARNGSSLSRGIAAEIQVLTATEEARRALAHDLGYRLAKKQAREETDRGAITRLTRLIEDFVVLIEQPNVHEKHDVHPYLKNHPFLLYQGPDVLVSEVRIGMGTEFQMDFLVRRPDGTYILIEIENPKAPIVTQSGDFSSAVNHALCQVEDWQEWIEQNLPTVDKYYPGIRSPEAWVIIGRSRGLAKIGERRIARRNINMRGRITLK